MRKIVYLLTLATTILIVAQPSYGSPDEPSRPEISSSTDGVTINGITWASRNVGVKGKFMDNPEDYGLLYDFEEAQTACPKGWRTPTQEEFELLAAANNGWATFNGINGRWFDNGGQAIFLPAAGYRNTSGAAYSQGSDGDYWSSTPLNASYGSILSFYSSSVHPYGNSFYAYGFSVRCVRP
ncbi:MAG: fibrobacter succinogenes major paralogous domain-containing protein [Rikenellaceae bacterium]|jgi:uncharacterized protein (TIGR02145 family)|nr:fibrobacter succinogenes major paralogous domain-containing protein [Rikenellaceae bacterium]